ncbi:MAG: SMC-Scp complex subunit ScpB [Chthoniobacterales bacterium]
MSKKSRKKQKTEELPAESAVQDPVETADQESAEVQVSEETIETTVEVMDESSEETGIEVEGQGEDAEVSAESGTSDVPEAVTEEALHGSVPAGEAPPLSHVIEAILFASQKAVTPKELVTHLKGAATAEPESVAAAFARIKEADIREALVELQAEVAASGRAYQVRETATGWLLSSAPGYAPWLRALYPEAKPTRLSPSALETLAIIAYRQPIARADMEAVRGVSVDGVMQTLLDRGLVKIAGRAEVAGRPLLYATTQYFLDHFGLRHLDELPNAAELRHIPLPKATPEQGAAGAQPDGGTPDLPGVSAPGQESANESPQAEAETSGSQSPEEVDVTEIIQVRESVVFEEVAFDAEDEGADEGDDSSAAGSSEEGTDGAPRRE